MEGREVREGGAGEAARGEGKGQRTGGICGEKWERSAGGRDGVEREREREDRGVRKERE